MAIDRPGAIGPHPRPLPKGRSAAQDGRPTAFLSSARNAVAWSPRPARGGAAGEKSERPPLRADDRGAAGPRPGSPIRGPQGAPGTRQGDWRQRAATPRRTGVMDGEDLPWRANTVSRISAGRCKPFVTWARRRAAVRHRDEPEQTAAVAIGRAIALFPARKRTSCRRVAERRSIAPLCDRDCERSGRY